MSTGPGGHTLAPPMMHPGGGGPGGLHRGSQDESLEPVTPLSDPDAHLVRRGALLPPKMEMDDEPGDILIENEELIEEEEDDDDADGDAGVNGLESDRQGDEVNIRLRSVPKARITRVRVTLSKKAWLLEMRASLVTTIPACPRAYSPVVKKILGVESHTLLTCAEY